ncbi:MAG: GTPase HflX [Phycisphaerales bacterium]|nr:GTPase HflX [Phycisphaerales bacterium]MCI0675988.1 GTPase HflX [Phycisphaerales bacterium]
MADVDRDELRVAAERAVLVGVAHSRGYYDEEDPLSELRALAQTAGAEVVGELFQKRGKPDGRTFLGKGKVQELAALIAMNGARLVIFDNELSPSQIGNLEEETSCKIVDRSELILDIFANRAATAQAKLQVEIAQLEYTYPRLRAMWDHLGQVTGGAPVGIGTRGPGEQQLEIDRRLVQNRLTHLKRELEHILERSTREVAQRNQIHFTVGLVGYTNAGKSTLFNRLTAGGAFADPKLFATLSTRIERWDLGGGNAAMLSDTVGFIRNLPHHLVASFRSTLEETISSKLLIIVLDVSDRNAQMQLETVHATLDEIGATTQPRILVLNKIDRLSDRREVEAWLQKHPDALPVSAVSGEGLEKLKPLVMEQFLGGVREVEIALPMGDTREIMFLEKRTQVLDRQYEDSTAVFKVRIGRRQVDQLLAQGGSRLKINGLKPHEALAKYWEDAKVEAVKRVRPHEKHVG